MAVLLLPGLLVVARDNPELYEEACAAVADGKAVETIIVQIVDGSATMSLTLILPDAPRMPALVSVTSKPLAGPFT